VGLHKSYHDLYLSLEDIKHHQKRVKKASSASQAKAQSDLKTVVSNLKEKLDEIEEKHRNPYMEKVRVHYPELHDALIKLKDKVSKDPKFRDLFPKELS
jgi:translation initiation factor 2 alpha subunit (eIF-2alpha)